MLARITLHAKRKTVLGCPEVADPGRRMLVYLCIGGVSSLGCRYPLAPLLSSVDVHRCDHARPSRESVGVFHRNLCRWLVGLRQHLCNYLLFQWTATDFSMGSHGAFGAAGLTYRGACLVFKSVCRSGMPLGVLSTSNEISPRWSQIRDHLRPYNWIFRPCYGLISASLSRAFPSNVAPTSALIRGINHMAKGRAGFSSN